MLAEGVERYIGIGTPSPRDPRDTSSLLGRNRPDHGPHALPARLPRTIGHVAAHHQQPLNWTIARFTRPTNGGRTGTVRAGYVDSDPIRASITPADIASFLLAHITDTRFQRAAPAISN
jgi:hypothetical protein